MGFYDHVHSLPVLFRIAGETDTEIADNNYRTFARISIVDVVQDPENPLRDYGEGVGTRYVRVWHCAWSITVKLPSGFSGDNPANLMLEVIERAHGVVIVPAVIGSRLRLPLGYAAGNYNHKGHFAIHSQEAYFVLRNMTGQSLTVDWDVWAKAYP